MKKKISLLVMFGIFALMNVVFAQPLPQEVQDYVKNVYPNAKLRFDGTIILPDATVYLPVIPAKFDIEVDKLEIKQTIPANKQLSDLPDAVIFNNDFSLLKVLKNKNGTPTLVNQSSYPSEIRSGIFPQDLFLPRRLVIPEELGTIVGGLESYTPEVDDLRVTMNANKDFSKVYFNHPALKNLVFYMTSTVNKNIKVVSSAEKKGYYAFQQKNSPNKIALYNDEFLLVSSYCRRAVNVISLFDEALIKEIPLKTTPDEIVVKGDIAYVASSEGNCIYVIDLIKMAPIKQILINGMCEKLTVSDDGTKLFYYDKQSKTLWAVEVDNKYLLKDVGLFPNVSKIAYHNGKIYVTSRTKNRIAIIDYLELNLLGEYDVEEKPVDMCVYNDILYILSARAKKLQLLTTETDDFVQEIELSTDEDSFPSKLYRLKDSPYMIITDSGKSVYYLFDLNSNSIVLTQEIDEPIANLQIGKVIRKFNDK